jgi:hypothetical protein
MSHIKSLAVGVLVFMTSLTLAIASIVVIGLLAEAARDYFGADAMVSALFYTLGTGVLIASYFMGKDMLERSEK